MTRLPRVSGRQLLRALRRGGFTVSHVRGSHHYLRRQGTGLVVVPVHDSRTIPIGTLRSILRQAELTSEELRQLLEG